MKVEVIFLLLFYGYKLLKEIKKIIPDGLKDNIRTKLLTLNTKIFNSNNITFSQSGEDILLKKIFRNKQKGFYLDIGAFHPIIVSNTHYFYSIKGWNGINIDASRGSMEQFHKLRTRDINLETAISYEEKEMIFYFISKSNTMNSFSKEFLIDNNIFDKVTKEIKIKTQRLDKVLDEHLPTSTEIDFMSVDVEGHDFSVLSSNNWDKYRPHIIIVETNVTKFDDVGSSDIAVLLKSVDYEIISIIYQEEDIKNVFFRNKRLK